MNAPLKILLVERDPGKAERVRTILAQGTPGEFELVHLADFNQALARQRGEPFDLLLLGLPHPSQPRPEMLARVRAPGVDPAIVLLTADEDDTASLDALCHGMEGCISARCPDGQCLAQALRCAVERKRQEKAWRAAQKGLENAMEGRSAEAAESYRAWRTERRRRKQTEKANRVTLRRLKDSEEEERRCFSRELHDCLGQDLTALKIGLRMLQEQSSAPAEVKKSVDKLILLTDGLMHNVHWLAWEMHPPALDDHGVEAAVHRYATEWSGKSGIAIDFHSNCGDDRLPAELETTLYRIAQEALTNVARHASARRVSILLERRPAHISLIVEDDGQGFDATDAIAASAARGKLGLVGMEERVVAENWTLQIESTAGAGTTVYARIPIKAAPPRKGVA